MNRDIDRGRDPSTPEQEYSDVETEICCNSYNKMQDAARIKIFWINIVNCVNPLRQILTNAVFTRSMN